MAAHLWPDEIGLNAGRSDQERRPRAAARRSGGSRAGARSWCRARRGPRLRCGQLSVRFRARSACSCCRSPWSWSFWCWRARDRQRWELRFAAGSMVGLGCLAAVTLAAEDLVLGLLDTRTDGAWMGWLRIGLAAVLAVLAVRQWRSRPKPGEVARTPAWISTTASVTAVRGFGGRCDRVRRGREPGLGTSDTHVTGVGSSCGQATRCSDRRARPPQRDDHVFRLRSARGRAADQRDRRTPGIAGRNPTANREAR